MREREKKKGIKFRNSISPFEQEKLAPDSAVVAYKSRHFSKRTCRLEEGVLEQFLGCGSLLGVLHQTAGEEVKQEGRHLDGGEKGWSLTLTSRGKMALSHNI